MNTVNYTGKTRKCNLWAYIFHANSVQFQHLEYSAVLQWVYLAAAITQIAVKNQQRTPHLRFSEGERQRDFIHTVMEVSVDALQRGKEASRVGDMNNSAALAR